MGQSSRAPRATSRLIAPRYSTRRKACPQNACACCSDPSLALRGSSPILKPALTKFRSQKSLNGMRRFLPESWRVRAAASTTQRRFLTSSVSRRESIWIIRAWCAIVHIVDMMRYSALNQGADDLASYGGFIPGARDFRTLPDPATRGRYSDEQLYALSLYLYSLQAPANPNKFDGVAARGERDLRATAMRKLSPGSRSIQITSSLQQRALGSRGASREIRHSSRSGRHRSLPDFEDAARNRLLQGPVAEGTLVSRTLRA